MADLFQSSASLSNGNAIALDRFVVAVVVVVVLRTIFPACGWGFTRGWLEIVFNSL